MRAETTRTTLAVLAAGALLSAAISFPLRVRAAETSPRSDASPSADASPPADELVIDAEQANAPPPLAYGDDRPGERRQPLALADVLATVDASYPLLLAVRQEIELAEGDLLAARGSFDTRLFARGETLPTGYYDRQTADLGIEQPTRLWGSRFWAGYRIGRGDFPADLGSIKTNESGEVRAGVEVPLLRDGWIDAARTNLRASQIKRRAADPKIELKRLEIVRQAAEAYWTWVAMGLAVDVERHLLRTAEDRRKQLGGRAERGAIPAIQVTDNERLIVDRAIRLRGAERDALEAAVALGLFYRDAEGAMQIPRHDRLPRDFPAESEWTDRRLRGDIARAAQRHPILRELGLRRDGLLASLALNRNTLLPDLRVGVEGSKDLGKSAAGIDTFGSLSTNPKDDTEVKANVRLEVPALVRTARGRVASTRAELVRLEQETRYARDAIEAEIRRAMAALQAAFDQTRLARESYALSARMQFGEERKLELGSSNLIDVNIREIQTADAARALIFAQAAYFRAIARYEAAIAADTDEAEATDAADTASTD